ncbi:MAG TPA: hypothetical protein VF625_17140 [Longimicrobium sp.]|jgi:hypothetical protein
MQAKLKVLFLTSDPFHERAPLRLDDEVRVIRRAMHLNGAGESVELVPYFATRTRDLQQALLVSDPRIVHFAGNDGEIRMGGVSGMPGVVGAETLATMFGFLSEWIKVVILNGCGTLPTIDALGEVVDYAIGMSQPLNDPFAIIFAKAFYGALGRGSTVGDSFEIGVAALRIEGAGEAAMPVLRIRPGVDPSIPLVAEPVLPVEDGGSPGTPLPDGRVIDLAEFRDNRTASDDRPDSDATNTHRIEDGTDDDRVFRAG